MGQDPVPSIGSLNVASADVVKVLNMVANAVKVALQSALVWAQKPARRVHL
jgi:hypothetical protein